MPAPAHVVLKHETAMTGTGSLIEWYLARDGKQYGPLSDAEMAKLVELGHLRPDDLVWKAGFPDWQAAGAVFAPPPPKPPMPPPAPASAPVGTGAAAAHDLRSRPRVVSAPSRAHSQAVSPAEPGLQRSQSGGVQLGPAPPAGQRRPAAEAGRPREEQSLKADSDRAVAKPSAARRKRGIGRMVTLLVLVTLLGGGAFAAYKYRDTLQSLAVSASTAPVPGANAPPLKGFSDDMEALDAKLQKAALWQLLRREFPEWYQERLKETARLTAEGRTEDVVARNLADALVALRRKNADHAFAASLPRLQQIAASFHSNLVRLGELNKVACFAFISQSEAHPIVVDMMQKEELSAPIQAQLATVFEAIAEGRRSPIRHLPPRKADYDEVTRLLTGKGWKDQELELFSDSTALAKAPPAVVCRLVTDWFDAHLAIKDQEAQTRLLVEAVRPVVGG